MGEQTPEVGAPAGASRFELAPPRRFILPAILLLLSERPGYGYGLVPRLEEFQFGHVDRPAVYRALARLEADRLVEPAPGPASSGQARRVYRVTTLGERVLRVWMGVVKDEHESLGRVLRRYQATGTTDAVLAEVEGGWAAALGVGWSPVSPTSGGLRHLAAVGPTADDARCGPRSDPVPEAASGGGRFAVVAERSVVLIEVRSTVGPLSFGTVGVTGWIDAAVGGDRVRADPPPAARLQIDVAGLRSGNGVYDAELLRRIDARRYPTAVVELHGGTAPVADRLYRLAGELTFHGATRPMQGTVTVDVEAGRRLVITGEQVMDIRDFSIPSPTVLMLRIYPDVRVRLHAEAELKEAP